MTSATCRPSTRGHPNVETNLLQVLRHPGFDPNREFSVPWQSGMGGVIVRTDLAPEVRSVCDLFDPKYKGKVDILSECAKPCRW